MIQPRTLKGFRDYLPEVMIPRERCMQTAREVFRRYGYFPIDTPALEYLDVLTGKGSEETDRQLYRFTDHGGRDVGMRFDLTVPLARFAAQHAGQLGVPFKRYQIAPVWRGENTQAGRYREFVQCDFDCVGTESVVADIETLLIIDDLMRSLGFERFQVHVNNRQVLTGLLEHLGLLDRTVPVLRSLDKLAKIGREKTAEEMRQQAGVSDGQADAVLQLAECQGTPEEMFAALPQITGGNPRAAAGIDRLRQIFDGATAGGVDSNHLRLDVSIARGLDYYTGAIFETFLTDLPSIGSVCSGGRYDNLAEVYSKQHLPGVGASLGLDRLLAAMEQLKLLPQVQTPAPVFIPYFEATRLDAYLQLASKVRQAGFGVELYPEPKKLGQQLKYADSRGFRVALIAGSNELAEGRCQVKDLRQKTSSDVRYRPDDAAELVSLLREILNDDGASQTAQAATAQRS